MAALPAEPASCRVCRAAGRLCARVRVGKGNAASRHGEPVVTRHHAGLRGRKYLCACQRLCRTALCRYWRSRKGGAASRRDRPPEVEDQIAQYQNSVQQANATRNQNQAQKNLAQVTLGRDSVLVKRGWVTLEQGDTDRYTDQAQQHATNAAQFNTADRRHS